MIGSCGHEIESFIDAHFVFIARMSRECKPVVSYETVCPACYDELKRGGFLLETEQERRDWTAGKIDHDPW